MYPIVSGGGPPALFSVGHHILGEVLGYPCSVSSPEGWREALGLPRELGWMVWWVTEPLIGVRHPLPHPAPCRSTCGFGEYLRARVC